MSQKIAKTLFDGFYQKGYKNTTIPTETLKKLKTLQMYEGRLSKNPELWTPRVEALKTEIEGILSNIEEYKEPSTEEKKPAPAPAPAPEKEEVKAPESAPAPNPTPSENKEKKKREPKVKAPEETPKKDVKTPLPDNPNPAPANPISPPVNPQSTPNNPAPNNPKKEFKEVEQEDVDDKKKGVGIVGIASLLVGGALMIFGLSKMKK